MTTEPQTCVWHMCMYGEPFDKNTYSQKVKTSKFTTINYSFLNKLVKL